jgi:hypothetical protein
MGRILALLYESYRRRLGMLVPRPGDAAAPRQDVLVLGDDVSAVRGDASASRSEGAAAVKR